ncbi:TetR/AcrR family transcriptional regulator [Methylorubrum populi]|uniref:TetR/AcrR family transcriptional regulator n=1 Tax=Methylorubrum rhodesianum TaxID=29427 RepID=A0ABU9Z7Q1_9HYPH|nr:TetR/AcrR family transcriptional regulator [Methylorubrum rhodesianum]MBK3402808.1 TetR/AcrR family transcriptional regulator [Methylorubrum rhodesianum]MBY0143043.1 TetR/AcrR family transcriptional regulator [Methylorubrum populi]
MPSHNGREARSPGRPRSEFSRRSVLEATQALLETTSIRNLTIEAIAQKAGVGKTTIYRWWSSKTAIVIEVFMNLAALDAPAKDAESASLALSDQISRLITHYRGETGRIAAGILAEGQFDPEIITEFRHRFFVKRRAEVQAVVDKGVERGEFTIEADVDTVIDMIYGAIYFRLLIGHSALDAEFAASLPAMALRVLGKQETSTRHPVSAVPS